MHCLQLFWLFDRITELCFHCNYLLPYQYYCSPKKKTKLMINPLSFVTAHNIIIIFLPFALSHSSNHHHHHHHHLRSLTPLSAKAGREIYDLLNLNCSNIHAYTLQLTRRDLFCHSRVNKYKLSLENESFFWKWLYQESLLLFIHTLIWFYWLNFSFFSSWASDYVEAKKSNKNFTRKRFIDCLLSLVNFFLPFLPLTLHL